ncbi:cryptochrome/photolyase family protein [Marinicella sp. W31]|uniref:cryptochrome/photolyase family protein n=1 Tax=Marinicella sp. W31 TaxID=3023713 RepID=UPI0037562FAE
MSNSINLIFPHQLFKSSELINNGYPCYLIEEALFFQQYAFHKQKLVFHRVSMKIYEAHLRRNTKAEIIYVASHESDSDIRILIDTLSNNDVTDIHLLDPCDDWLERRLRTTAHNKSITIHAYTSPAFLNSKDDLSSFFKASKKKFYQTSFYKEQRISRNLLIEEGKKPVGGQWSFDADNRKKYPKKKQPPLIDLPEPCTEYQAACEYVSRHFGDNPGTLTDVPQYPYTFELSEAWLEQFLQQRFEEFGDYEDAIVASASILNHSLLSPLLNVGLLEPQYVIDRIITFAESHQTRINSVEGLIRQIIGWREFIRGVYVCKGGHERTLNYWGFKRSIPQSFYTGETGIDPIDTTIQKVLETGYCHHIERLMVLGNFMLLCEFDPDEVYQWFMELFIDAYDWVMVPNVYGMSQFADGGLMSTKPYISGSNYLIKMSDYKKGEWSDVWDALFWRFMHTQRDFFLSNPRLSMLIRNFDNMDTEKQDRLLSKAENYLKTLD